MPWFSNRTKALVPDVIVTQLGELGAASLEARARGRALDDPRFSWDDFFSRFLPAYQSDFTRAIAELHAAAGADPLARFGGSQVVAEFEGGCQDPLHLDMVDGGLQLMHDRGLSSAHLTRHEADRWVQRHGDLRTSFDGLVDVAVPTDLKADLDLQPGRSVMVARMGPDPVDNEFHIERRADGEFTVFSMREWERGDGKLTRCEEQQIPPTSTIEEALLAVGEMLRTPPYWAHDQLQPCFPERRTR
jgi:hypothetical protein